jgi:chitinase
MTLLFLVIGVDLDWEYPVAEDRGGTDDDTGNFVSLVQEMRDAFDHLGNTDWDISVALAPDYWYMRYFDAKGMEPHVSWFNFMTYDLHGAWDSDIKYGKVVRGQADLTEIRNNIIPLAFADMNMSKINFGMAYYGRGYKLAGKSLRLFSSSLTRSKNTMSHLLLFEILTARILSRIRLMRM